MLQAETLTSLESYKEAAKRAHYNTSFIPEKRGEQLILDYTEQLKEDVTELQTAGISEDVIIEYVTRYKRLFSSWLHAKSNTFSVMITGGSNFPVKRHEKANRSEQRHYELWQEWRKRAIKAIKRKPKEEKTFLSELDRYRAELEAMKANHEKMKEANKRIAAAKKSGEDISQYLIDELNIPVHMVEWTMRFGFGLANNNANMRRVEERIKLMEKKNENASNIGQQEKKFDGFTVIYNHEADRLQIKHDVKPPQDVIYKLKSNGFRWSPFFGVWQRQLNSNGIWAAERVLNVTLR